MLIRKTSRLKEYMTQENKNLIAQWTELGNMDMVNYLLWWSGQITDEEYELSLMRDEIAIDHVQGEVNEGYASMKDYEESEGQCACGNPKMEESDFCADCI
jgi:hypothetical protein